MSQCYLGSEYKTSMTKLYFEVFISNHFYTFNKKDPVLLKLYDPCQRCSKSCLGPPKIKKWLSQKKRISLICPNRGIGQNSGSSPEVVGSLGVIFSRPLCEPGYPPIGWGQILECMYFTYFPINCMLRSFQCFEISLSDQTPGVETLSKVCVWTNESSAGSVLCSHWSRHKL